MATTCALRRLRIETASCVKARCVSVTGAGVLKASVSCGEGEEQSDRRLRPPAHGRRDPPPMSSGGSTRVTRRVARRCACGVGWMTRVGCSTSGGGDAASTSCDAVPRGCSVSPPLSSVRVLSGTVDTPTWVGESRTTRGPADEDDEKEADLVLVLVAGCADELLAQLLNVCLGRHDSSVPGQEWEGERRARRAEAAAAVVPLRVTRAQLDALSHQLFYRPT